MIARKLTAALLCASSLAAAPALAADEAPISTGSGSAPPQVSAEAAPAAITPPAPSRPPISTSDQITNYLATSPAADIDDGADTGVISGEGLHREIHGVVDVSVGSHGYRNIYARSDIPIGKTGQLSIAVQDGRGRGYWGRGYGYGYGPGYYGYGGPYGYGYGRGSGQSFGLSYNSDISSGSRDLCLDRGGSRIARADVECRRIPYGEPRL